MAIRHDQSVLAAVLSNQWRVCAVAIDCQTLTNATLEGAIYIDTFIRSGGAIYITPVSESHRLLPASGKYSML